MAAAGSAPPPTEALLLADDLLTTDPQAAVDTLDKAIGLDRCNEQLYRKAVHARHALADPDSFRNLLRALTRASPTWTPNRPKPRSNWPPSSAPA